ncbi:hypothetical protein LBMAG52_05190 [Planctomycetia bacterium]|nr:hypothetical protein LBMAG52_05190 [Planctomycetia bacterium]
MKTGYSFLPLSQELVRLLGNVMSSADDETAARALHELLSFLETTYLPQADNVVGCALEYHLVIDQGFRDHPTSSDSRFVRLARESLALIARQLPTRGLPVDTLLDREVPELSVFMEHAAIFADASLSEEVRYELLKDYALLARRVECHVPPTTSANEHLSTMSLLWLRCLALDGKCAPHDESTLRYWCENNPLAWRLCHETKWLNTAAHLRHVPPDVSAGLRLRRSDIQPHIEWTAADEGARRAVEIAAANAAAQVVAEHLIGMIQPRLQPARFALVAGPLASKTSLSLSTCYAALAGQGCLTGRQVLLGQSTQRQFRAQKADWDADNVQRTLGDQAFDFDIACSDLKRGNGFASIELIDGEGNANEPETMGGNRFQNIIGADGLVIVMGDTDSRRQSAWIGRLLRQVERAIPVVIVIPRVDLHMSGDDLVNGAATILPQLDGPLNLAELQTAATRRVGNNRSREWQALIRRVFEDYSVTLQQVIERASSLQILFTSTKSPQQTGRAPFGADELLVWLADRAAEAQSVRLPKAVEAERKELVILRNRLASEACSLKKLDGSHDRIEKRKEWLLETAAVRPILGRVINGVVKPEMLDRWQDGVAKETQSHESRVESLLADACINSEHLPVRERLTIAHQFVEHRIEALATWS